MATSVGDITRSWVAAADARDMAEVGNVYNARVQHYGGRADVVLTTGQVVQVQSIHRGDAWVALPTGGVFVVARREVVSVVTP